MSRAGWRTGGRWFLVALYLAAGLAHIAAPRPFVAITPHWVPSPAIVIQWTGIAELLGAIALAQPVSPWLRKCAGIALALYAICVFPANINHFAMDMHRPDHGFGLAYHVPRMIAQPLLVWLALWSSGAIEWPWRR